MRYLIVAGLLALGASGCSQSTCGPQNCVGCCDESGACVAGDSLDVCGHRGEACRQCPGNSCADGVCASIDDFGPAIPDEGQCRDCCPKLNGTPGDHCPSGCCVPNDPFGSCVSAPSDSACGASRESCHVCDAGLACVAVDGGGACQ